MSAAFGNKQQSLGERSFDSWLAWRSLGSLSVQCGVG